jgi:uncharacterized protein YutE (UPF0331/DUF86 family)
VDATRVKRYLMKGDHGRERLAQATSWAEQGRKDVIHRLASYKAFQESAEAIADLVAMALNDKGRPPTDDYSNLERAAQEGIISASAVAALAEATGLRNRLVHEYDGVDVARAAEAIARLAPVMEATFQEVESWVRSMT